MEKRLPDTGSTYRTFVQYQPSQVPEWTPDEALAFLLLTRLGHPEYKRRQAASVGLCALLQTSPATLQAPMRELLRADTTGSTAIHYLQILWTAEDEPFPVTDFIYDELCALRECQHLALRASADRLICRCRRFLFTQFV